MTFMLNGIILIVDICLANNLILDSFPPLFDMVFLNYCWKIINYTRNQNHLSDILTYLVHACNWTNLREDIIFSHKRKCTASSQSRSLSYCKFSNIIYFNGSMKKQVLEHVFLPHAAKETKGMEAFKIMNSDFSFF